MLRIRLISLNSSDSLNSFDFHIVILAYYNASTSDIAILAYYDASTSDIVILASDDARVVYGASTSDKCMGPWPTISH